MLQSSCFILHVSFFIFGNREKSFGARSSGYVVLGMLKPIHGQWSSEFCFVKDTASRTTNSFSLISLLLASPQMSSTHKKLTNSMPLHWYTALQPALTLSNQSPKFKTFWPIPVDFHRLHHSWEHEEEEDTHMTYCKSSHHCHQHSRVDHHSDDSDQYRSRLTHR